MPDPVTEDEWLALAEEAKRTACDLEKRVEVVELYKRAIAIQPCSNKIWLAYCEWVRSLHNQCQVFDPGWTEEERSLGQEIFNLQVVIDLWQQGTQATRYRLNDSHEIWNRYISIELDALSDPPTDEQIENLRILFIERLKIPHATWDETSQMFSTFLSNYRESDWESTMVEVTKISKDAKIQYGQREPNELKLQRAVESGDLEALKSQFLDYLNWEQSQALKITKRGSNLSSINLCVSLFERALTSAYLAKDPILWEDYIIVLLEIKNPSNSSIQLPSILSICHRATKNCPWSGALWARYILCAEMEPLPFSSIEQIKHAATNTGDLDRDGINDVVLFYVAWCGYLKRRTLVEGATDEDFDLVEMGLPTALEDVRLWGKRRYGKSWKGDPYFRIESILIQTLTEKGYLEEARSHWRELVATHADSYDFWYQYYQWEMIVRNLKEPPINATRVLLQAIRHKTLDWPEKIMEIYIKHCDNYEKADTILQALNTVHRISKGVIKRREREAFDHQTQSLQLNSGTEVTSTSTNRNTDSEPLKRKREDEEDSRSNTKKLQTVNQASLQEQYLKRDRENTTIVVKNLPVEVTQTKVKQYFKDYAHINSIVLKTESDGLSAIALIELRTREDVQSALLKHNKYFGDQQISVAPGTGLTLYVTNYPPAADDKYFHELFKDCGEILSIRWPSIKFKTTRRFIYISFRTPEGAEAATKLDGLALGGVYKLSVAYSNPNIKKDREGATAEGRELHVTNLDTSLTEEDVKEVFAKYGTIQKVNILKKLSGKSKGAAFIVFENKEEAYNALNLDKTKLKSRVLSVEISKEKNFKPTATVANTESLVLNTQNDEPKSPQLKSNNGSANSFEPKILSGFDISNRSMALLNLPDTINDTRVRLLVSSFGDIVRLVLRPDYQGALVEFANPTSAGRAIMSLDGYEIIPGHKIRTGSKNDLFKGDETLPHTEKTNFGQRNKSIGRLMQQTAPVRRPAAPTGIGIAKKKKLEYPNSFTETKNTNISDTNANQKGKDKKQMKNADFKALFSNGK
ncbi:putative RNA-binding protein [Golovinomyces cichoracearum]|uniref:U4/U6 snRNA-associated-splicing factor PRP24 n=1 Tax=Golovinomyces cichoracearum TaxID=62708 RepID=A0A420IN69_9PEZI|nr:putative RNA-binding protein [Golovinomyces cichoracearum]